MRLYGDDLANVYGSKRAAASSAPRPTSLGQSSEPAKKLEESAEATWIYSFADLIMNLLMFFMMMFAISSVDPEKLKAVKQAISGESKEVKAKQETGDREDSSAKGELKNNREILESAQELLQRIDKKKLDAEKQEHVTFTNLQASMNELKKIVGLGVALDPERDVFDVVFSAARLFDQNNNVSPEGKKLLQQLSKELKSTETRLVLNIQAHTSPSLAQGDSGEAFRITSKRAFDVLNAMKQDGLGNKNSLSMSAFGSMMALIPKKSPLNERVVVRVGRAIPRPEAKIFTEQTR